MRAGREIRACVCALLWRAGASAVVAGTRGLGMGSFDHAGWLAGVVTEKGVERSLTARLQGQLAEGFTAKTWDESNVPSKGELDEDEIKDALELWAAIMQDSAAASATNKVLRSACKVQFNQWFKTQYKAEVDEVDEAIKAYKFGTPSADMARDMSAQGMSNPEDLFATELSIYLGRPVAFGELEGAAYKQHCAHMKGAIRMKKASSAPNVDDVIRDAVKDGNVGALRQHFLILAQRLSASDSMAFNGSMATLVMTVFNKAETNIRDPLAIACYFRGIRSTVMGQGFPFQGLFNVEIAMRAKEEAAELRESGGMGGMAMGNFRSPKAPSTVYGGSDALSSASGYTGLSGLSARQPDTERDEQMAAMMASLTSLADQVKALSAKVPEKPPKGGETEVKCWVCGSTEHRKPDCPVHKAREAEKAAKDAKDKAAKAGN